MQRIKVCLVGGQPAPNLLSIKHYRPGKVILVCSEQTRGVSERLQAVLEDMETEVAIAQVDPYNIEDIKAGLDQELAVRPGGEEVIVNITGGTKLMSYGAIEAARAVDAKVVYLQSGRSRNILYNYSFKGGDLRLAGTQAMGEVLNIDEYLRIHVGKYSLQKGRNKFEAQIRNILAPHVTELNSNIRYGPNVELDLAIRIGNQVGIVESTVSEADKKKIDQLNSAVEPLGIYVRKFLVTNKETERNNAELAEIYNIELIELLASTEDEISRGDQDKLVQKVKSVFN